MTASAGGARPGSTGTGGDSPDASRGRRPGGPDGGLSGGPPAGENPGWTIFGYLLAGMGVYGGIGWLIGRWAGNPPIFLAGGMVAGLALAIALTIFRYGRSPAGGPGRGQPKRPSAQPPGQVTHRPPGQP
jgi:hypothetical protein